MKVNRSERKITEEDAWLRLVHTKGIGHRYAWKIYHKAHASGLTLSDVFSLNAAEWSKLFGGLNAVREKLRAADYEKVAQRYDYLLNKQVRLCHPGSRIFAVPEIRGLPPTLTTWGDFGLLNSRNIRVLMKSRNTPEETLRSFLQKLAQKEIGIRNWCLCPFGKIDWELIESMLKVNCGLVLGLVSGISRKALLLARETPPGRMLLLAPEPPLTSRWALFSCIEAFYRLFAVLTGQIFLLYLQEGGKTARRLKWAQEMNCKITRFPSCTETSLSPENEIGAKSPPFNGDDQFITCL